MSVDEKQLNLMLANHTLEVEKKVGDKIHSQELMIQEKLTKVEKTITSKLDDKFREQKQELDEKFITQKEEISDALYEHRKICENVFIKADATKQFVTETNLQDKVKTVNEKIQSEQINKLSSQSNLVISVVKIISWFVMAIGFIIVILIKLGFIKVMQTLNVP